MTAAPYWESYTLVPLIAWSYVFFGLSAVVNVGLFVHHKTGTISGLVFVTFVVNILGDIVLIPRYGGHGAAVATLISFVLFFFLNLFIARRFIAIAFEWRKIIQLMVVELAAASMMFLLDTGNMISDVVGKILVMGCFLGILMALGFFSQFRLAERATSLLSSFKGRSRTGLS